MNIKGESEAILNKMNIILKLKTQLNLKEILLLTMKMEIDSLEVRITKG